MLRKRRKEHEDSLRRLLGDFELPTIPAVVTQALERLADPDAEMREVGEIVATDPGLSARLLTIVNSAAYAPRNPITGIPQAVMMLGRNHLESLLIPLAARGVVKATASEGFNLEVFWGRAAWRATTAAAMASRFDRVRRTEHFTAALLQDIAVPVLARTTPGYDALLRRWEASEVPLAELERAEFGWTHFVVAGWMFDEWGFPETLRDAVMGVDESYEVTMPIIGMVALLSGPGEVPRLVELVAAEVEEAFTLGFDDAVALIEEARTEAEVLAKSFT